MMLARGSGMRAARVFCVRKCSALPPVRPFSTAPPARRSMFMPIAVTAAVSLGVGYLLAFKVPPSVSPFSLGHEPATELPMPNTPEAAAHMLEVEKGLYKQHLAEELMPSSYESPTAEHAREACGLPRTTKGHADDAHFVVLRPFMRMPPEKIAHRMTGGMLRGPGGFATAPIIFSKTRKGAEELGGHEGDGSVIAHIGRNLCGYEGVVHGGLICTMFDEALARTAFYALPNNIGVTAKLEVNYRKPTKADQYVVIETKIVESVGRKAIVKGELRDANTHTILAEADGVFVEPRMAKFLKLFGGMDVRKMLE